MQTAPRNETLPATNPALFALLVNEVVDYAIFMLAPDGRVATWNKGAQRIKGYHAEEIIGRHFSQFYPADDVKAGKCEYELEVAAREGRFEDEGWRVRKDGTSFWANVVITALRTEFGELQGFAKVTRDLTARKEAEETARQLAKEEAARLVAQAAQARAEELVFRTQRLQDTTAALGEVLTPAQVYSVIESKVLPALGADGGSVALLSPDLSTLELVWTYGYSDEVVNHFRRFSVSAHLPHSDAARTMKPVFLESTEAINGAYPQFADTNRLGALASLPLVVAGRCVAVLGVTRRSPRHFTEEEKQFAVALAGQCVQALERARILQIERQRSEFAQDLVAIVSHDLRSPITAMLMAAGTALRRHDIDERLRTTITRILSSGERATRLIRDILDFTQARAGGGIPVERKSVHFGEVVSQVVDEIHLAHADRQISLEQTGPLDGQWDSDRIAQIVTNLVGNAAQHSPAESPVKVTVTGTDEGVTLSVMNPGPAIPADELPHLFQAYRRARVGKGMRKSKGIGLGLYITKQLVEAHGGTISVSSSAEEGTTFTVWLPRNSSAGTALSA